MHINDVVSIETLDNIALICLNNPPVNAASQALRVGLQQAVAQANADTAIDVMAIYAAGRTFVAGADIKEFGKPPLIRCCQILSMRSKAARNPSSQCLHGTALGGGLEIALGAHLRVGLQGLKVGLPEIHLGLLPGAGGTQRTPRLIGIPAALEMILSGRHVGAAEALELGLIDRLSDAPQRSSNYCGKGCPIRRP